MMSAHIHTDTNGKKFCLLSEMPEPSKSFASAFFPCSSINPLTGKYIDNDDLIVWFDIVESWGDNIYDFNQMVKNYLEHQKLRSK